MSKKSAQTTLFSSVKPNLHLLHLSVTRQLNNSRAGTASTKTKSEVRGGGKKPWKQKGTGRARAGSIRSPLWVGGGITFGPKPRDYKFNIPKKALSIAILQAFAAKNNEIQVVKELPEVKDAKTKTLLNGLKSLDILEFPLLVIAHSKDSNFNNVKRASRNVEGLLMISEKGLSTYEILKAKKIMITEAVLEDIEKRFAGFLDSKSGESSKSSRNKKVA